MKFDYGNGLSGPKLVLYDLLFSNLGLKISELNMTENLAVFGRHLEFQGQDEV